MNFTIEILNIEIYKDFAKENNCFRNSLNRNFTIGSIGDELKISLHISSPFEIQLGYSMLFIKDMDFKELVNKYPVIKPNARLVLFK